MQMFGTVFLIISKLPIIQSDVFMGCVSDLLSRLYCKSYLLAMK